MSGRPKVQLVGGPRDGQYVEDYGPIHREPIPRRPRAVFQASAEIPVNADPIPIREYVKERWFNGELTVWRYVARDHNLGQSSFRREVQP